MMDNERLQQLAVSTIDQVVINGEVNDDDLRVSRRVLARVAFKKASFSTNDEKTLMSYIIDDDRFVGIENSRYRFRPEITEGSEVKASPRSIVKGTAIICSDEERDLVYSKMNYFADIICNQKERLLSIQEIGGILKSKVGYLSYDDYGGFIAFIHQDERFKPIGADQVIVTTVGVDEEQIEPRRSHQPKSKAEQCPKKGPPTADELFSVPTDKTGRKGNKDEISRMMTEGNVPGNVTHRKSWRI